MTLLCTNKNCTHTSVIWSTAPVMDLWLIEGTGRWTCGSRGALHAALRRRLAFTLWCHTAISVAAVIVVSCIAEAWSDGTMVGRSLCVGISFYKGRCCNKYDPIVCWWQCCLTNNTYFWRQWPVCMHLASWLCNPRFTPADLHRSQHQVPPDAFQKRFWSAAGLCVRYKLPRVSQNHVVICQFTWRVVEHVTEPPFTPSTRVQTGQLLVFHSENSCCFCSCLFLCDVHTKSVCLKKSLHPGSEVFVVIYPHVLCIVPVTALFHQICRFI